MLKVKFVIASLLIIITSQQVGASCLLFNENERLSNFCLMDSSKEAVVDQNTALLIFQRLKNEGYFGGLDKPMISTKFYPDIDYSSNINGGNPNKPLIIGGLEFKGDPDQVKEEGFITRPTLEVKRRSTYGVGSYMDTNFRSSYSYSPEYRKGYADLSLENCFVEKFSNEVSIDFCGLIFHQNKELAKSTTRSFSVNLSNVKFVESIGYSEVKIGISHLDYQSYDQNQLLLAQDIIHKGNLFSGLRFRLGQPLNDTLAMKYGLDISLVKLINNRKISLSLIHEISDGGKFLGFDRKDEINKAFIQSAITSNLSFRVGYTNKNSNIDYFDTEYPSIKLTYNW